MANLIEWILEEADGKPILGVVIGPMGWGDYGHENVPQYDKQQHGKLLSWEQAQPLLRYEFHNGYGAPGCNAIYAWTEDYVIAISQYDGSTSAFRVPRNPIDCMPQMPGG
jgi:hypothetical protein